MKKPIIKNWIKYWSTTLAVSGMLVVGACDSENNNTADNAENTIENAGTTVEENATTARENVNQNFEEAEAETEQAFDETDQTIDEVGQANNQANNMAEEETQVNQPEYERTSNTAVSSELSASPMGDMDAHVDEFEQANQAITETLTDENNQLDAGSTPEMYDEQEQPLNNTEETSETNETNQYEPVTNTNPAEEEDEMFFEDEEAVDEDENPAAAEEEDNELFFEDEEPVEEEAAEEQNATEEEGEMFFEDEEPADDDKREVEEEGEMFFEDEEPADDDKKEATGEVDNTQSNIYDKQSNTNMSENIDVKDPAIAYEQYIILFSRDLSDEDRQRMDEISRDYLERREKMSGQINDETGAYIAPEVEATPTVGYQELMNNIQENIEYPQNAVAAEMEGTVFVNFIIDENGNVVEAQAFEDVIVPASSLESTTTPLNPTKFSEEEIEEVKVEMRKEAVRAVEATSGMWEPAMHEGQTVKTELQLPVKFKIAEISGAPGANE